MGHFSMKISAPTGSILGGTQHYDLSLAAGDRVRLFRRTNAKFAETNSVGNIGRNGSVLEVTEVRGDGLVLRNQSGREGFVAWSSMQDEPSRKIQLAYGDALTTYTAQGTTVSEHIHAIPDGSRLVSAFAAYTSGSRHRTASYIVTSEGAEQAEIIARRPLGDRREVMRGDILSNIVRNFSQQPVKETALNMLDRAAGLRRGTIQDVQKSLQSIEHRLATGHQPITLDARYQSHWVNHTLKAGVAQIFDRLIRRSQALSTVIQASVAVVERLTELFPRRESKQTRANAYWQTMQTEDIDLARAANNQTEKQSRPRTRSQKI